MGRLGMLQREAGALAFCTGTIVFFCWAWGISICQRLFPHSIPMMPNTALGFLLLGAAMMADEAPYFSLPARLARLAALSACALGALTLGEYALGIDLGLDQLFCRMPAGAGGGLHPGRMAPDTAAYFILLAAALWLKGSPRHTEAGSVAAVIFSLIAAAGGLTVLLVTATVGSLGWMGFTAMAAPTGVLFAALGLALTASLIAQGGLSWALDWRGTAVLSSGLVLVVSVGLYTSGGVGRSGEIYRRTLRQEEALRAAARLLSLASAAQASAHGHVITGDARLVTAYLASRAECAEELSVLRRLTDEDPQGRERTAALETQLMGMLDWWSQAVAARRPGAVTPAALRAISARDHAFTTALTAILAREEQAGRDMNPGHQREFERLNLTSGIVIATGTILGLAALVTGLLLLNGAMLKEQRDDEALRRSESRFRSLFESSRDALMTSEYPSLRWNSGNRAAVAMFQAKDEADLVTRAPEELSPARQPDGRSSPEKARELVETALREGSAHFEWTHKRLGGEEFPADVLLTRTESGGKTFLQATVRDLTAAKRATSERRLLASAIEQASESVIITDAQARILYVNPSFSRVTGYSRSEALGRTPALLKSGRHDRSFYQELWETLARGQTWRGRIFNRRKDGTIYEEESSIAPVRRADGAVTHYIAVKRDVSKERELEAQFLHSQKMEAVGRLAGGVAHDFNNILTAIIGSAELVAPAVAAQPQAARDLVAILDASRRAAALTRQLLTFSRRQAVEHTTLDLNAAVAGIQSMLRRTLGEQVRLESELPAGPVWIEADAGQIDQVLLNLAVNARDALPQGGALTFSVSVRELAVARVSPHDAAPPGVYALLRCADEGAGMSGEVLARLFEPFFTTKEKGKGTGLGLSTVHGIVKQAGGHIFIDSAPGRGTTFDLLFPLAAPPAAPRGDAPGGAAPGACRETILLVEDEEAVLRMLERTLRAQGYTVLPGRGAAEALAVSAAHRGTIHLLLTDVVMPGMSGPELARLLAKERPDTRILYMSGYPDGRLGTGEVLSPGPDLLHKPFHLSALSARVRRALDAGSRT